ncbi:MAG: phosphoribosylamine--glycine ligase [Acidiferrobacteraceae bacterium]
MKVLVIGGGGREHALVWKVAQSGKVSEILAAPGNPGTASVPRCRNVALAADDVEGLTRLATNERVDLVIVGPEVSLALGITDRLATQGVRCFGPTRRAAEIETSKAFAKEFMIRHGIPTPRSVVVTRMPEAQHVLAGWSLPVVIKADGLAGGKGVIIARHREDALSAVHSLLEEGVLGAAGRRVLIEEFISGEELSFIVMAAHGQVLALADARDHKRRDDGDLGPNTGGMGAYSPVPGADLLTSRILSEVILPAVHGLSAEGRPYTGFLYAGLMVHEDRISVLEFNCRLGDPETQVILPRLRSDLVALIDEAMEGRLGAATADWDPRPAITVVVASDGYPGNYRTGLPITGLAEIDPETLLFHAGTAPGALSGIVTAGGRVVCVGALGDTIRDARTRAYGAARQVSFEGAFYRRDIGLIV